MSYHNPHDRRPGQPRSMTALALWFVTAFSLVACSNAQTPAPTATPLALMAFNPHKTPDPNDPDDPWEIGVYFGPGDCPLYVSQWFITSQKKVGGGGGPAKNKQVTWQSYSVADPNTPTSHRYEIFFDPFQAGPPYKTNNGRIPKKRLDADAPTGNYKYVVVGKDCAGPPLDPFIRIVPQ
jgi:hypothetical protein